MYSLDLSMYANISLRALSISKESNNVEDFLKVDDASNSLIFDSSKPYFSYPTLAITS